MNLIHQDAKNWMAGNRDDDATHFYDTAYPSQEWVRIVASDGVGELHPAGTLMTWCEANDIPYSSHPRGCGGRATTKTEDKKF